VTVRVLIVGGYGIFGGRLVELLKDEPRLALIVAGRSPERAKAFCARQQSAATLEPAVFDRNGDLAHHLATLRPDLLVDASGPYQAYGQDRYRVIEACIAKRVSYLDLADGADFVDGVRSLDAAARTAGVFVLSGVSSFPVLTAAAARRLAAGLVRIDAIRAGIAPSPHAIVGENVIRAITGYAGQPTRLRRDGQTMTGYPFTEQMRFTIAPPARRRSATPSSPWSRFPTCGCCPRSGPRPEPSGLDGRQPDPGARSGAGDLELEDYDRLFARRMIHTGFRD